MRSYSYFCESPLHEFFILIFYYQKMRFFFSVLPTLHAFLLCRNLDDRNILPDTPERRHGSYLLPCIYFYLGSVTTKFQRDIHQHLTSVHVLSTSQEIALKEWGEKYSTFDEDGPRIILEESLIEKQAPYNSILMNTVYLCASI